MSPDEYDSFRDLRLRGPQPDEVETCRDFATESVASVPRDLVVSGLQAPVHELGDSATRRIEDTEIDRPGLGQPEAKCRREVERIRLALDSVKGRGRVGAVGV